MDSSASAFQVFHDAPGYSASPSEAWHMGKRWCRATVMQGDAGSRPHLLRAGRTGKVRPFTSDADTLARGFQRQRGTRVTKWGTIPPICSKAQLSAMGPAPRRTLVSDATWRARSTLKVSSSAGTLNRTELSLRAKTLFPILSATSTRSSDQWHLLLLVSFHIRDVLAVYLRLAMLLNSSWDDR